MKGSAGYKLNDSTFIWTDKRAFYYWVHHIKRFTKWLMKVDIDKNGNFIMPKKRNDTVEANKN